MRQWLFLLGALLLAIPAWLAIRVRILARYWRMHPGQLLTATALLVPIPIVCWAVLAGELANDVLVVVAISLGQLIQMVRMQFGFAIAEIRDGTQSFSTTTKE